MTDGSARVLDQATVRQTLREFVTMNFLYDGSVTSLTDDASLAAAGILDATGILELALFIEETFGFDVDESDLTPENFDSIAHLTRYVLMRLSNM